MIRLFASFLVLISTPVMAQSQEWSSASTPLGTVSAEFPCADQDIQIKRRERVEANRCDASGVIVFLFVLPVEMLPAFNFPGGSLPEIREKIDANADTVYLKSATVDGYEGFYSEGRASSGTVAVGLLDLGDGRIVMLNVQSDGSAPAEKSLSDTFIRTWESLQVIKP